MDMKKRMELMALKTWDVIGGDCLTVLEEMDDRNYMTKDEVIEVVCDAGYMKMHGGDKEAYEYWSKLPNYDEKMKAIESAFLHERYGW